MSLTLNEWNCNLMIDPIGAVMSQVFSALLKKLFG